MPQIHIDLRRDLPKVREQLEAILPGRGQCLYASPCVIGAMVPPRRRAALDRPPGNNDSTVTTWARNGRIAIPEEQLADAQALQTAFDIKPKETFLETLARLEAKYLTGEVG